MKNLLKSLPVILTLFLIGLAVNLQAQKQEEKKVVIVKKTIDQDGNENVTKKILEGKEAEDYLNSKEFNEDLEGSDGVRKIIKRIEHSEIDSDNSEEMDVEIEETDGVYRIKIKKGNGDNATEDIQILRLEEDLESIDLEDLEELEIDIEELLESADAAKAHCYAFKSKSCKPKKGCCNVACDKPMLGVMIEEAGGNGALVTSVIPGSGAAEAGLEEGDLIYKVGKSKVTGPESLVAAIKSVDENETVKVRFFRNGDKEKSKVTIKKIDAKSCCVKKNNEDQTIIWKDKQDKSVRVIVAPPNVPHPPAPITELDLTEIMVFPNPSGDQVTLEFKGSKEPTAVKIISTDGAELYSEKIDDFDGNYIKVIDLPSNHKGGAILQIIQGDKVFSETIIKQ